MAVSAAGGPTRARDTVDSGLTYRYRVPRRSTAVVIAMLGVVLGAALLTTPIQATTIGPQVVNGTPGDPDSFGALVALADRDVYRARGLYDAQICGGTAVTPRLIITAAHCVVDTGDQTPSDQLVVAHTPSGVLSDPDAQVVRVKSITVNPDYDERTQNGDIAVLRLTTPLESVTPMLAALPAEDAALAPAGANVRVGGWGATTPSGRQFPDRFRVGDLVVFPDSACGGGEDFTIDGVVFRGYRSEVDPALVVCAEGVRSDQIVDSCIGDSGGPLIAGRGEAARLIGVVSWGPQRCASQYPGVYSRVSAFTAFLRAQGVPFAPTPTDAPRPPSIVESTVAPTSATISVVPAETGPAATSFLVSASDRDGRLRTCTMPAAVDDGPARCTLEGLRTSRRYTVTAVAFTGSTPSETSPSISVRPVDRPARPRIVYAEPTRGGIAVFGVDRLASNGSPLTKRLVACRPVDRSLPKRTADIGARGIATVTGLSRGAEYSCRAKVANALGSRSSSAVTVRAR